MKVEIINTQYNPKKIIQLYDYLESLEKAPLWIYKGMTVAIDPTFDFQDDNVLIRWIDINEGFNDKTIYHSLVNFKKDFQLLDA